MASIRTLDQSEMIQHIKFITEDLFKDQTKRKSALKSSISTFIKTIPRRLSPDETLRSCECYHRLKSKVELPESGPSKRAKPPILKDFSKFWSQNQDKKEQSPIIDRINKGIYHRFMEQSKGREFVRSKKTKDGEQIWHDFLKRENQWIEGKKKVIRQAQIIQQERLSCSRSRGRSRATVSAEHEWREVEKGIRELREKTDKLKTRILDIDTKTKKRGTSPLLAKTFNSKH